MPYHVSDNAGRRVVGIAFRPGSLAMQLKPSWRVRLSQLASAAIVLAGVRGLLIALVCLEARRMVLPFIVIGLACWLLPRTTRVSLAASGRSTAAMMGSTMTA